MKYTQLNNTPVIVKWNQNKENDIILNLRNVLISIYPQEPEKIKRKINKR